MKNVQTISAFNVVKRKWMVSTIAADILIALSVSWVVTLLGQYFFGWSMFYMLPVSVAVIAIIVIADKSWRISNNDVVRYFDENFIVVEESSGLLLKPAGFINHLQHLQVEKIAGLLEEVKNPGTINRKLFTGFGFVISAIILSILWFFILSKASSVVTVKGENSAAEPVLAKPAAIARVSVTVIPPAYTRLSPRIETDLNIIALVGSTIQWNLETSNEADSLTLLLNDRKLHVFTPSPGDRRNWELKIPVIGSGYYQLNIDGESSALYQLQATRDGLPKISLISPEPDRLIKYGEEKKFLLHTEITDDYGVKDAYVLATVSSGSGEAVQFSQKRISFGRNFKSQSPAYSVRQHVLTDNAGMRPGDELYFYVVAIDNKNQQTRSDMRRVILEDTSQLFSVSELEGALNIKPEFFRSQRQIIIETEQLLRDQKRLSKEEFENKSNSLGIDQKLLRLRYGKFLGEEDVGDKEGNEESNESDRHDGKADQENASSDFGHSHDNAEDATYFDEATKKQLRATLNEMWKAELQLRTFKPKEALPFELEALRLLKDLQQRSRVYVAKTSSKTTPLDLSKRFSGEQEKIISPVFTYNILYKPNESEPLQNALTALYELKAGSYSSTTVEVFSVAEKALGMRSVEEPTKYLSALNALRTLTSSLKENKAFILKDILLAEQGINAVVETPLSKPGLKATNGNTLSELYFNELEKKENR